MGQHLNLIDTVAVADVDTAVEVLETLSDRRVDTHQCAIHPQSRRDGIGDESQSSRGIGEGDMVAVGRYHRHRHVAPLALWTVSSFDELLRIQHVL